MAKANGRKPKSKTSEPSVELIAQPHGGAIQRGNPGNSGGGTLTKNIREAFKYDLETARQRLVTILDNDDSEPRDLIAIFDKLAKYSIGERKEVVAMAVDTDLMNELGNVVARHVMDDEVLEAIKEEWLAILASRVGA